MNRSLHKKGKKTMGNNILFLVLLLFKYATTTIQAILVSKSLRSSLPHRIVPVTTFADVMALADLRYEEWIVGGPYQKTTTSRASFRAATAEIVDERTKQGAMAFLAYYGTNTQAGDNSGAVVAMGAAELSPIEVHDVVVSTNVGDTNHLNLLYVTDVVTSQRFRRQGVAKALMRAMETCAATTTCTTTHMVLHVDPSNTAALQFYQSSQLGYDTPTPEFLQSLDADKLAHNAGTEGQILLVKAIRTAVIG